MEQEIGNNPQIPEQTLLEDSNDKGDPIEPPPKRPKKTGANSETGASTSSGSISSSGRQRQKKATTVDAKEGRTGGKKQSTGRLRLPMKLLNILNENPMPEVFWWMPDGKGFAYNEQRVQAEFLDIHFGGSKVASFVRSLNRWGFRRVFYHALPENVVAFYHPKFKKDNPGSVEEITMASPTSPQPSQQSSGNVVTEDHEGRPATADGALPSSSATIVPPTATHGLAQQQQLQPSLPLQMFQFVPQALNQQMPIVALNPAGQAVQPGQQLQLQQGTQPDNNMSALLQMQLNALVQQASHQLQQQWNANQPPLQSQQHSTTLFMGVQQPQNEPVQQFQQVGDGQLSSNNAALPIATVQQLAQQGMAQLVQQQHAVQQPMQEQQPLIMQASHQHLMPHQSLQAHPQPQSDQNIQHQLQNQNIVHTLQQQQPQQQQHEHNIQNQESSHQQQQEHSSGQDHSRRQQPE